MSDKGHEMTDEIIEQMRKRIAGEYKQAAKEVDQKFKNYMASFAKKEEKERERLEKGEITQQQFDTWRITQMLTGKRWEAMRDRLAEDILNTNEIARSVMGDHLADVYAVNRNYAAYQIEQDAHIDTSWTVYNRRATERLFENDDRLLPLPKKGGKAWKAMMNEDTRWNTQKIHSSLIQGILQGDGADQMAERMQNVVGMNYTSSIRSARTMSTYIQSRGRQDTYDDLGKKGINIVETWVATLDDRTRASHRWLHGTHRDPETGKFMNGLDCPADPTGDPAEVYNCRCTIRGSVEGFDHDVPKLSPKIKDFEEWLGDHNPYEEYVAEIIPLAQGAQEFYERFQTITGIDDKFKTGMANKIAECDDVAAQNLYYKYADQLVCRQSNLRKNAYFSNSSGGIFFGQRKDERGDNCHAPYQTVYHEFGHMIDWLGNGKDGNTYLSGTEIDGVKLIDLIEKDYQNFKKKIGFDEDYDVVQYLKAAYKKADDSHMREFANVSDIFEYCTDISYPLGVGHGRKYHHRDGATEKEFFAEVLDSCIANEDAYKRMQEFFPESVDWVWKAVRSVL